MAAARGDDRDAVSPRVHPLSRTTSIPVMAEIHFDLSGFTEYERGLARMIALLSDMRPFWPRLVPIFVGWVRERFASEGDFGGEPWEPLSESYLAFKQRVYPGKGILYATGQLRRHTSKPVRIVTARSLTFEIPDFSRDDGVEMKMEWFQSGTDKTPPRQIIPDEWNYHLPAEQQAQVELAAQEWIDEMAYKLGLR